ncbi:phage integrase [Escherichia coli]|uniref:phage integrase n=1 Tax=Escherichia coli TaxID=562 RepID=UPI0030D40790
MTITKKDNGKYMVDVRPAGRSGKRVRRSFSTKSEAVTFERWIIASANNKEWLEKPADRRRLSELIELWWKNHGQTLTDCKNRLWILNASCARLNNPRITQLTAQLFAEYRTKRRAEGIAPKTLNNEQRYLKSVFSKLKELDLFWDNNPMTGLAELKLAESEQGYFTDEQIRTVLTELTGDNKLIAKLCLSTGARWSEGAKLTRQRLVNGMVTFTKTKNGKSRSVPIGKELEMELMQRIEAHDKQLIFPDASYQTARKVIKGAVPDLPDGQATHAFRHTFASHFMANGGNILVLQQVLGHHKIQQTMTYAHFAPDHLFDAVTLNPLATMKI